VGLGGSDISEENCLLHQGEKEQQVTANIPSLLILSTLMMEAMKCRLLQEPHGVTSQKMAFFILLFPVTVSLFLFMLSLPSANGSASAA
jgi:hypothetical protein